MENNALNDFLAEIEDNESVNPFETEQKEAESAQPAAVSIEAEKPVTVIPQNIPKESARTQEAKNEPEESGEPVQVTLTGDPLEEALKKSKAASADRLIGALAEKNPVFKYGSASELAIRSGIFQQGTLMAA